MTAPAPARYQGDFIAWPGGCGFLGLGGGKGAIDPHSHYAIQLAVAAPSGLGVQFGRRGTFERCAGALVPSRAPHTIDVTGCEWSAVLFIEPETTEGRALAAMMDGKPCYFQRDELRAATDALRQAWLTDCNADAVRSICRQLVRDLAQASSRDPADPRVLSVIDRIQRRPDQPMSLEDAAAVANLSPSRFRHLFVAETGMPLRTYQLWRRILHVWSLLMEGETLSRAAHAAGFADSAHLSRTSRTMFGLPPSALQMGGPLTLTSAGSPARSTSPGTQPGHARPAP